MTKFKPTTDVNAQFATEKLAQMETQRRELSGEAQNERRELTLASMRARVEKGEVSERQNADGSVTFTALQGWDRGETWNVSKAKLVNPNVVIEANHGLETGRNGEISLYLNGMNGPAWHSFGNVIPGGLSETEPVLKAGGLWFDVEKFADTYTNPVTGETETMPGAFKIHRMDTGVALGRVGNIYNPVQNREAYEMLSELIGLGMVCESAGVLEGGAKVFVSAEIPTPAVIDPNGIADQIRQFLVIMNSHDGKGQVTGVVTPWRVVCGNTHRFALRDAAAKFQIRHTKNAMNKIAQAKEALGHTVEYFAEYVAEETELVQATFGHDELDALIKDIYEMKPGKNGEISKRAVTISKNRTETLHELFEVEAARNGRNAYAAQNAVTGYVDHFAELRPRGDLKGNPLAALGNAILNGDNDEPKERAHRKLLQMVRTR